MKKLISLLLAMALLMMSLAACTEATPDQPETTPDAGQQTPIPEDMIAVSVDPATTLRTINASLFGAIQNQGRMGEGAADEQGQPYPDFVEALKTMGVTELRYPGGSMGGMIFDWREAIGPIKERKLTYARTNNPGQILNYGVDEMAQMAEDCGMALDLCINSHMLGVKEALEYLAYTTMPTNDETITDENDLQYWANLRAAYGHPEPYYVTRVDIGNEEDGDGGWRSGEFVSLSDKYEPAVALTEENAAQALYAFGGITYFDNVNTITYEDLSENAAVSDGTAGMQKRAPYVDIVEGTCHIYVDGEEWSIIDNLSTAGAKDKVCTVDYDTGYITFGDGTHGAILAEGKVVTISYQTEHEGYVDYYNAIHDQFPGIHVSAKTGTEAFMQLMGDEYLYDSISYHPLGANQPGNDVTDFTEHYYQQQASGPATMAQEAIRWEKVREYSGRDEDDLIILSAYGHSQRNYPGEETEWHLNLAEGMLCASELMSYIDGGFTVACNFLLNDLPFDPDKTDAPTARRFNAMVIGRLGSDKFVITSKGLAFSLLSKLSEQTQVAANVKNNPVIPLNGYDPQSVPSHFPYFPADNLRTDSIDTLQVLSAVDENGGLSLIVMNNHVSDDVTAYITLNGYTHGGTATVSEYNGESITSMNTTDDPNAVTVTTSDKEVGEGDFEYSFPAHSITLIKMTKE